MNEQELSEYCRENGLYVEQIERWREPAIAGTCYLSHYPTIDFPKYFTVIKGKFLTLTAPVE
uniref:Uncharacterized protein n=1 Tax=Candidatus Kentrum sp. TUN TaxID=2126343 RepID=A0A451ALD1_9GAMM|nr:MAG: hypothetical protein BECKTUN1418D_GA0071000_16001 [Candidatus Kentron sp. TUN]